MGRFTAAESYPFMTAAEAYPFMTAAESYPFMTAAESYPFCKHHLFFKNKGGPACLYLFQMTVVLHTRHLGAPVPRLPGGTVALSRVAVPPSGTCWRLLSLSRYFSCILLHLCTGCAGGQANQIFCLRLTRASRWLCRAAVRCVTDAVVDRWTFG